MGVTIYGDDSLLHDSVWEGYRWDLPYMEIDFGIDVCHPMRREIYDDVTGGRDRV